MTAPPASLQDDLRRAHRLEWWTLFWQGSIVGVMALVLGSSQAMKSAWIEDLLGLVPATVFLIAAKLERNAPTDRFPYGFHRVNSLAFMVSAAALVAMGGYLLADSALKLVEQERQHLVLAVLHQLARGAPPACCKSYNYRLQAQRLKL